MYNSLLDNILKEYRKGDDVNYIAFKSGLETEQVIDILRRYAKSQRTRGQYSEEIKELIADRDNRDALRKDISNELGVSRSLLVSAIENYGTMYKSKDKDAEELFMNVGPDFAFKECPKCGSTHFNDISGDRNEGEFSSIYCKSCGSEFVHSDGEVRIVRWEYID